jgi:hypothetical protein
MNVKAQLVRKIATCAAAVVVAASCIPAAEAATPTDVVGSSVPTTFTDDGSDSYTITAADAQGSGMSVAELQALYDEETAYLSEDDAAFQGALSKTGATTQSAATKAGVGVPALTQADIDAEQAFLNSAEPADDDVWEDATEVVSGTGGGEGGGYNGGDVPVVIKPPSKLIIVKPPTSTTNGGCSGCGGGGGGGGSWGGYKCLPKTGDYCWHGQKYMKYGRKAIAYANSHTGFFERYPVPFPTTYGGRLRNKNHTVYVVRYLDKWGNAKTWKFGITSIPDYTKRARVGKALCNAQIPSTKNGTAFAKAGSCYYTWVGVTAQDNGWRRARYLEASLILWYSRKGGGNISTYVHACPPGQAKSCR